MHYVTKREAQQKARENIPLKPPKTFPKPLKSRPWALLGAKMQPSSTPDQPTGGQKRPRGAQEVPKRGQESPKSAPSDAQGPSKRAPNALRIDPGKPQDEFVAHSLWEALFGKLLERFLRRF